MSNLNKYASAERLGAVEINQRAAGPGLSSSIQILKNGVG